ncbi:GNAT family N-acetyltransferase [Pseudomonas typographi]|uniref:GNAT family N-acetyltransferase n=1 Tax=Pseudomonas typographi TaxID=2715964 RepID=UPI00168929D6|nr:GNAT family N-acetyltransferase [Pseudomonas typographi]MBD1554493.1 GNAT family N-acetyltransferase [Pseudomonas typographi]
MGCQVRPATSEDAAAISRVVIAALHKSNSLDYSPEVITQVEKHFSPGAVSALLSKRKVFVALLSENITGTASLEGDVVRSVFVDPAYQGIGMGRQLMEVIHATAARAGIGALRVPSSITAQGFHATLGYRKIRGDFHGAERTIVMAKQLED